MDYPDTVVQQLFLQARDLAREQRASFLDAKCKDRPERRRQIEELLKEYDRRDRPASETLWESATLVQAESLEIQPWGLEHGCVEP